MLKTGLVTKINLDIFTIRANNKYIECKVRGKIKEKILVGDNVYFDEDLKTIEKMLPRKNFLKRPPVSNIDAALIVTSLKEPNLNLTLLDKLISLVEIAKIEPIIVLTKIDLDKKFNYKSIKKYYENIGIKVYTNKMIRKLKKYLKGKMVTVCGQTGAGKSTLINKLDKSLNLETKAISKSLGRGVHTTRIVEIYEIDKFLIVDTPGFSSLDINDFSIDEIKNSFREFRELACQYKDCKHVKEKGCAVLEKVSRGEILDSRYKSYLSFIEKD